MSDMSRKYANDMLRSFDEVNLETLGQFIYWEFMPEAADRMTVDTSGGVVRIIREDGESIVIYRVSRMSYRFTRYDSDGDSYPTGGYRDTDSRSGYSMRVLSHLFWNLERFIGV